VGAPGRAQGPPLRAKSNFFDELIKGRKKPLIEKGYVEVTDRPGLGIELDEQAAYKYRKQGEPFFDQPA